MPSIFDELTSKSASQDEFDQGIEQEPDTAEPVEELIENIDDELRTTRVIREVVQKLFKNGDIEEVEDPGLYRAAVANAELVERILEPFDLNIQLDELRGLAFITVRQEPNDTADGWTHPLVRRLTYTLEQTLLIALLRQHLIAFEMESGVGAGVAQMTVDDVVTQLHAYLGEPGSDLKDRGRATSLLEQLKNHHLVTTIDSKDRFTIRPLIAHVANPENLTTLIRWLETFGSSLDRSTPIDEEGEERS